MANDAPIYGPGGLLLPHYRTFSAIVNSSIKQYPFRYDEALRHSTSNALAMRRDAFIMACLRERQLAVAQLPWHIEPEDANDPNQKAGADRIAAIVRATPRFTQYRLAIAEKIWYGRYGVQQAWAAKSVQGRPALAVVSHQPVNGDKIQFTWDGVPAVMIHSAEADRLVKDGSAKPEDIVPGERCRVLLLRDPLWRQRFAIAKHECDDADYFEGEMSGAVHGVGIRSRIYWAYWLRDEMLSWAMSYMEKVGTHGLMLFYYENGNAQAKEEAIAAAKAFSTENAIAVPKMPGQGDAGKTAELIPASTAGIQSLQSIISEYFERHIERYIVGQSMSSGADNESGLGGSGRASLAKDTKYQLIRFDAENDDETLTQDLVNVIVRWNRDIPPGNYRFASDLEAPDGKDKLDAARTVYDMGIAVKVDEVRQFAGLSKPTENDESVQQSPQQLGGTFGGDDFSLGDDGGDIPPEPSGGGIDISRARDVEPERYAFDASKVHRGQPQNAGQFGPGGGPAKSAGISRARDAEAKEGGGSAASNAIRSLAQAGQSIVGKADALKGAAAIAGQGVWDSLPPKAQKRLVAIYQAAKWVEHKAMLGMAAGQQLARDAAAAAGRGEKHVDAVARYLATADLVASWTVNFPLVTAATGSPVAGKAASFLPLGSLAYLAGSTAANPMATIKAARKLIREGIGKGSPAKYAAIFYAALDDAALDDGPKDLHPDSPVTFSVTVPPQPPPVVNVTLPPQPPPIVNVSAGGHGEYDVVPVRDADGNAVRFEKVPAKAAEYDIVAVRDPGTGLAIRYERAPKRT